MKKCLLSVVTLFISGFTLAANNTEKSTELSSLLAPYDEWYFDFVYPKALPAVVTYAELLDTDGVFYRFRTLDGTKPSKSSIGKWGDKLGFGLTAFNKAKNPPQFIHFCWDSVIDKKVYETRITFSSDVWKLMLTPYLLLMIKQSQLIIMVLKESNDTINLWLSDWHRKERSGYGYRTVASRI